jgi:hypothetical protein
MDIVRHILGHQKVVDVIIGEFIIIVICAAQQIALQEIGLGFLISLSMINVLIVLVETLKIFL